MADAAHYVVRRDGVVVGEQATALDFEDVALEADLAARAAGAYVFAYTVVAVDEAGNASAPSAALAIAVDIGGSGAPRLLVAPSPTADRPHLTWQPVESASAYAVVRDGAVVATVADPAYTDDGLVDDGTFTYAVRALGAGGALLGTSSERVVDYDTTPPPTPARPEGASPTNDAPSLTWQRVAGATSYRLLRDGALVGSTASAGLVDDDLATDGAYQYAVVAVDAAGNASAPRPRGA